MPQVAPVDSALPHGKLTRSPLQSAPRMTPRGDAMLVRTVLALILSVPYGVAVSLMTLPMVIAILFTVAVLSTASPWVAVIAGLCSLVFQAIIYAQSARYAAMLTGLQPLSEQPRFLSAMGRTLLIIGIVGIFSALVLAAALVLLYQFGADTFWWMDRTQLANAVQTAMKSPARGERSSASRT